MPDKPDDDPVFFQEREFLSSVADQTVTWSRIGDTEVWRSSTGETRWLREGSQHVAGPFATLEEAVAAMNLILMPPQGNA